jgi:hypothetical protein
VLCWPHGLSLAIEVALDQHETGDHLAARRTLAAIERELENSIEVCRRDPAA